MERSGYRTTARSRGRREPATEVTLTLGQDAPAPPHDLNAEAGVLGSMMLDEKSLSGVLVLVTAEDFFDPRHQALFEILKKMWANKQPIDGTTLIHAINTARQMEDVGGKDYLQNIVNNVPTSDNAEYYAGIVKEMARKRAVLKAAMKTVEDVYGAIDTATDLYGRAMARLVKCETGSSASVEVIGDVAEREIHRMETEPANVSVGIQTGYPKLDSMTGGLFAGENIVIAARPSVGKTALAMNILANISFQDIPTAIFSMEMSKEELTRRFISTFSGVPLIAMRTNALTPEQRKRVALERQTFNRMKIHIADQMENWDIHTIRAAAQRLVFDKGVKLLAIDYLQLMTGEGDSRQEQIASVSREVKKMARALNVPVLLLSQLNRDSEKEMRRPRVSDLRESGAIEQDADTVWLLHREAVLHRSDPEWAQQNMDKLNEAFLIIGKQRNGMVGDIRMGFDENATWFHEEQAAIKMNLIGPAGQYMSERPCNNCGKGSRFDASFCWNCGMSFTGKQSA